MLVRRIVGWCVVLFVLTGSGVGATSDRRLVDAVRNRDLDVARALVQQRVDVNAPQSDGATALHWAAHWDFLDIADVLLRAGADVNASNDLGVTPLMLACTNRNAAMVERLLQAGANPNAALSTGATVLMAAARAGSVEVVTRLLTHGADVNARERTADQTALMWAVSRQHSDVVRLLVAQGADVRARSRVRRMFVKTADPLNNGPIRSTSAAWVDQGGYTPLLFAARQGMVESAKHLLAAGADVNEKAPLGTSALVVAAHSGHAALGQFLLENGAAPDAADAGYAALHAAVLRGDMTLVTALLRHGADPNVRLRKGTPVTRYSEEFFLTETLIGATPFFLAAKFAEVGMMRALAAAGADTRLPIEDGTTPLMAAAGIGWGGLGNDRRERVLSELESTRAEQYQSEGTFEAVKVAIDLGGNVNAVNEAGETALHGVASKGFTTAIQLLANNGADLNLRNNLGQTALQLTLRRRQTPGGGEAADLLRKLGAK